jgi:hypothetical protein
MTVAALLLQIQITMAQIRLVQAELRARGTYVNVDANPAVAAFERMIPKGED